MANEVEIRITATDLTGPAFSAAMGKLATLKAMADSVAGDRQINFDVGDSLAKIAALKTAADSIQIGKVDQSALNASLTSLKSKIQSLGIADIADVNVPTGKITSQMQLLHRLVQQSGISDILDFNLNPATVAEQLDRLGHLEYDIPVKFDVSKMPSLGNIGTQRFTIPVTFDYGRVVGPTGPILHVPVIADIKSFTQAGETMPVLNIPAKIDIESIPVAGEVSALSAVISKETELTKATESLGKAAQDTDYQWSPLMNNVFKLADEARNGTPYLSMFGSALVDMAPHAQILSDVVANHLAPAFHAAGTTAHEWAMILGSGMVSGLSLAGVALGKLNDNVSKGIPMWTSAGGWWGIFTGHLVTFGGALSSILPKSMLLQDILGASVSGWHLMLDAIIETGATLIPAILGIAAFGTAAIDTTDEIYNHFVNMDKVIDMTNQSVYPLTGAFSRMNQAAQPQVYTLLGEGLQIVNKNSGVLQSVALAAGKSLDDLGARFTYAMTNGGGFASFMKNSASDISGWGDLIGNLGGIIGNVFKQMPGYAEILLHVADGFTAVVESITGSAIGQAVIGFGLAMHGAVVYIGILATAASVLISKTLPLIGSAFGTVAKGIAAIGFTNAADDVGMFGSSIAGLSSLPWGWITLAAAGIGVLVYEFLSAKSAAQQFADAVQKTVDNVKLSALGTTLTGDIHSYSAALKDATVQSQNLKAASGHIELVTVGKSTQDVVVYSQAANQASQNAQNYAAALRVLQDDQDHYNNNLAQAAKVFGDNKTALEALTNAGITSSQMLTTSKQQMAENIIQAQAYNDALKALTGGTGRYAAAMNALSGPEQFLGDMLKNIQQITQAQDNLISVVTEGQGAWDTFMEGTNTLQQDLQGTGAKVTDTLGKISVQSSGAAQSISGLTTASINANQAFYAQVTNGQKVIDALEQQEASTGQLTTATATLAGQMIPFAGNNTAARATLVAMINDALGPGTVSLQSLNTWVGKNSTSLAGLNNIIDQSTIKAGTLANVLQTQLNSEFEADLLNSSGATGAMKAYTDAIVNNGDQSSAAAGARAVLIHDLEQTGMNAGQATSYVDGLQTKIDGMHGHTVNADVGNSAIVSTSQVQGLQTSIEKMTGKTVVVSADTVNAANAVSSFQNEVNSLHGMTVQVGAQVVGPAALVQALTLQGYASGGLVGGMVGGSGPDDRMATVRTGEFIVNPTATAKWLPFLNQINGMGTMNSNSMPSASLSGAASGVNAIYGSSGPVSLGPPSAAGGWGGYSGATPVATQIAIALSVQSAGQSSFERFMLEMIRNFVRVKGGGNVQAAFGKNS